MAPPPTGPDSPPLFEHLDALYPLACLLVGPESADELLVRVYEKATGHPVHNRPDDTRGWLVGLLLDASTENPAPSGSPERTDRAPFRHEAARQIAENALPAALAACTARERVILALEVGTEDAARETLTTALDAGPDRATALKSEAWEALEGHLHAALTRTEQKLVDEALFDEDLREMVQTHLQSLMGGIPSSLRGRIRTLLQDAHESETTSAYESHPNGHDAQQTSAPSLFADWSRGRLTVLVLTVLGVATAGVIGLLSILEPAQPTSSAQSGTDLVPFTAQRVERLEPRHRPGSVSEAETYVESTWGRRIRIPSVTATELFGVAHLSVGDGPSIPVFLYRDTGDSLRVAVAAYDYRLLDQLSSQVSLATSIRNALASRKQPIASDGADESGVLWRQRDDIFVAVSPSLSADSLRSRIQP